MIYNIISHSDRMLTKINTYIKTNTRWKWKWQSEKKRHKDWNKRRNKLTHKQNIESDSVGKGKARRGRENSNEWIQYRLVTDAESAVKSFLSHSNSHSLFRSFWLNEKQQQKHIKGKKSKQQELKKIDIKFV